jgi:tRNA modification GTPase
MIAARHDTIAAISTAPGLGAIGVIRISGPAALDITSRAFSKDLRQAKGYSLHFGQIRNGEKLLDEVVVAVFRAPKSFTKEDVCEISFHGSPYILREALELFTSLGARLAEPGEFTQRAYLNGAMDLAQAEAVADLIASSTAKAHELALKQLKGGVSNEIKRLRGELLDLTSLFELELDFGEEDVEFADRERLQGLIAHIIGITRRLASSFKLGNAIKEGIGTVIAGRPNAGKSTLLNALLQEERAIVSDIAGTTRDTIEAQLVIEGVQFRLIDTAGIREAQDTIEAIGVERTFASIAQAQILVYVYDASALPQDQVQADLAQLQREGLQTLVIANKIDKLYQLHDHLMEQALASIPPSHIGISNKEGQVFGHDSLRKQLYESGIGEASNEAVIISNIRHHQALQSAAISLEEAQTSLQAGLSQELVAIDIRHAIHHLGTITGEITTDEVLGNIFGKFCIGK